MINTRFLTAAFLLLSCPPGYAQVERVWLSHRANDPCKLVVNWMTTKPGESVVRFGRTSKYGDEIRVGNDTAMHHVEIPLAETGGVYHYSVSTGSQTSENAVFKAYPTDVLRVAIAADWQGLPDLSAIIKDDVHLLLTAGDNIAERLVRWKQ